MRQTQSKYNNNVQWVTNLLMLLPNQHVFLRAIHTISKECSPQNRLEMNSRNLFICDLYSTCSSMEKADPFYYQF